MVIDAKDGGIISRPRLWWFDIDWDTATQQLHSNTPWQITQTFHQTMWRLTNPIAAQLQPDVQVRDWEPPTVLQQNQLFHCLTTQASSDDGRPPPRSSHVDNDTWRRWEDHNKQFPPWQYRPEYLTRYKDGHWQTVTPLQRERTMGFPDNYTNTPPTDDRTRNCMLGNTGTFQQQYGYYSSSYPPTHKLYQYQSSIPTSRKWQPFGRQQQHLGDQPIILLLNTTCRSSIGHNTYTGPVHTTNEDTNRGLLIRPYIGQYNNNDTSLTSNKSDKTSFKRY